MLLQANDYWWLHEHAGCELQVGGSDQWGNITAGHRPGPARARARPRPRPDRAAHHPGRRPEVRQDRRPAPVWLDPERTSPYELLPVLRERRRPGRRAVPAAAHAAAGRPRWPTIMAEHAGAARRRRLAQRRAGRERDRAGARRARRPTAEAGRARASRRPVDALRRPRTSTRWPSEIPTAPLPAADARWARPGRGRWSTGSRGRRGRGPADDRAAAGIYVNDEPAPPGRVLDADDLLHDRYVMLRRGKKHRAPAASLEASGTP